MIDPKLKRALGQMIKGVQVVGAVHEGAQRGYCSHWVSQVAFEEPIVMASMSPKHDTHPVVVAAGEFAVSILGGDQVDVGQYFSYPGRRFRHIAREWTELVDDRWLVVPDCVAWLGCEVLERMEMFDHELFFARVVDYGYGRLKEPPLLYSPRLGWRITGDRARTPGRSIRDQLLERLRDAGYEVDPNAGDDEDDDA